MYNPSSDKKPGDLGYYLGYKIVKTYYNNSKDKKRAIYDILNITDFDLFLKQSQYIMGLNANSL